ncbi:MlaD family protein [Hydrogenimonas thermophila]|uniref:MlaD family protein n=1 Tax=Hydrogenimonas thermophila TaxID=223786 RepID=UPI002937118C|nr:MlaD family protein [Hydrogenimonas thermophila]WOE71171.1 MlaD family protein [Hydrogenimonas thermophila]WOE73691.1 MlaD family protein [Hydrogenimonas thermophila]
MESRPNYNIVGAFVLILGIGAIFFALWMGNINTQQAYNYYYTYMEESVAGLPPDGTVKYMGVDIGKVKEIYIDQEDQTRIRLKLQLPKDFRVREGMYTTLKFAGITGITYIEIVGGQKDAPVIKANEKDIPIIPSKPSALAQIGTSFTDVTTGFTKAISRINRVLSDKNIEHINNTLEQLDSSSKALTKLLSSKNLENIETILNNLAKLSKESSKLIETIESIKSTSQIIGTEGNKTMYSIKESADAFKIFSNEFRERIEAGDYDIRQILKPTIEELNTLLQSTQTLIYQLQEDAQMLKESPSNLLFKEAEPLLGPGEGDKK